MKKILVVDDEQGVREILEEFLQLKGYQVKSTENGAEGLDIFNSFEPDLAVVDIQMPVMDGVEFSKAVFEKYPDFPIIIITAYYKQYNIEDILSTGVKEVIIKPIQLNDLTVAIEKYLP